jgi:hypothetical protein
MADLKYKMVGVIWTRQQEDALVLIVSDFLLLLLVQIICKSCHKGSTCNVCLVTVDGTNFRIPDLNPLRLQSASKLGISSGSMGHAHAADFVIHDTR